MLLEQAVCFCCEPRLVAKLDRDSYGPVEKDQRFLQQSQVDLESRRQLQQNGAELRTESAGPLDESVHRLGRVLQPLEVGEVAAHLQREEKILGRARPPVLED